MGPVRSARRRRRTTAAAAAAGGGVGSASGEKKTAAGAASPSGSPPSSSEVEGGDWWEKLALRIAGNKSLAKDQRSFESILKMSRKTFNYVCSLVRDDFLSKATIYSFVDGKTLTLEDIVAVALRRLNSGESLVTVGSLLGVNHSTVSQITWRFVEYIELRAAHHLRWPTLEEMEKIKLKFEKVRGLPNCCGVVDTTHITMLLPTNEPNCKVWLDSEKNYSMVLQVVVDPDMRFRDIVTGWPGSMKEPAVLQNSGFYKLCDKGGRLNGKAVKVSDGSEIKEYIIGDAGYPLLQWLLTPYQGKDLTDAKVEFNKRHFGTRLVAPRALKRFKDTWKFLYGEMWRPDKHRLPRIIHVCCMLHNIIIDMEDEVGPVSLLPHDHDTKYKQQFCSVADESGSAARDIVAQYLSSRWTPLLTIPRDNSKV